VSKQKAISSDEQAFLAAIAAAPEDATARLVYADWLEERDDPRAAYLRFLCDAAGWQNNTKRDIAIQQLQQLGDGFKHDWKAAVQIGLNWRTLFEANLQPPEQREYGEVYELNPPATPEQLTETEEALGVSLPLEVRSLWSEFNGIQYADASDREAGREPESFLLDLQGIVGLKDWMVDVGWPAALDGEYGTGSFQNLLGIRDMNGRAEMLLLCLAEVGNYKAGTVVFLDQDTAELEAPFALSLTDYVARRYTERFSHW
jgi:uncharacterized protein (TIGR02996 family)